MGCFVRGGKNGTGCFVRSDKNCMGCFVRGGKLMRDVLSGVAKNGMGCFVPGCFVLHSGISDSDELKYYLCVKSWLCKQEVASSVPTGTSILFYFYFFCYYINNDRPQVH